MEVITPRMYGKVKERATMPVNVLPGVERRSIHVYPPHLSTSSAATPPYASHPPHAWVGKDCHQRLLLLQKIVIYVAPLVALRR